MRVAARFAETWVTTGDRTRTEPVDAAQGARDVRIQIDLLEEACADAGRDPATLARLVVTGPTLLSGLSTVDAFADTAARYAAVGVTDLVVPGRERTPRIRPTSRPSNASSAPDQARRSRKRC
jgi:alkanesulfonate monooxygenase SsuD/methylene tetrahydromethanopterin reductase-like flavin-dependent oxidoreductase (luciferase family)